MDPVRRELRKLERELAKTIKTHRKKSKFKTEDEMYDSLAQQHEEQHRLENLTPQEEIWAK